MKKSHRVLGTPHVLAEVQNCHWIWSTHPTEATGEKNQEKNEGETQCTLVNEDH